jgi:hypothetical protein
MERKSEQPTFVDAAALELDWPRTMVFLDKCEWLIPWEKLAGGVADVFSRPAKSEPPESEPDKSKPAKGEPAREQRLRKRRVLRGSEAVRARPGGVAGAAEVAGPGLVVDPGGGRTSLGVDPAHGLSAR